MPANMLPRNSRLACRLAKACMPKRNNMPASIAAQRMGNNLHEPGKYAGDAAKHD